MTEELIKQKINKKVMKYMEMAKLLFPQYTFPYPKIIFKTKSKCAGIIKHIQTKDTDNFIIDFNLQMAKLNGDKFIKITPAHEIAHLISAIIFGKEGRGHSKYWKEIMKLLIPDEKVKRCHNYIIPPSKKHKRKFIYHCDCRDILFGSIRHNRAMNKGYVYTCTYCGGIIRRGRSNELHK